MAAALSAKQCQASATAFNKKATRAVAVRAPVVVRAQSSNGEAAEMSRRSVLGLVAGVASLAATASPSLAAYGDAANVFGKVTNRSGTIPYAGEGFAVLLPSKWNPSKEKDFEGEGRQTALRYEDNGDAVNNLTVLTVPTSKNSIEEYGGPDKVLQELQFLFGKQTFAGDTISEGGFAPGRVSAASLLDVNTSTDKKGKKYYKYELLVRTADGDEGGRHQLISATVGQGKLWVLKVQIGDKRWFKGAKNDAFNAFDSWTVA
jgi:hypothetical protein